VTEPDAADPRVQSGLEHLQRAAHEMIAATRALLDVAEELVDDPRAAAGVVDLLGSVAGRRTRSGGAGSSGSDDGGDEPPVQRIPVS
jgi:hypothetical protein